MDVYITYTQIEGNKDNHKTKIFSINYSMSMCEEDALAVSTRSRIDKTYNNIGKKMKQKLCFSFMYQSHSQGALNLEVILCYSLGICLTPPTEHQSIPILNLFGYF